MKHVLFDILNSLSKYNNSNKENLMRTYIESRLFESFNVYQKELENSIQFLSRKHEKSVIKRISKLDDKHC